MRAEPKIKCAGIALTPILPSFCELCFTERAVALHFVSQPSGRQDCCATGNVAKLRELGMPCEFAHPDSGSPSVPVAIHLVKGARNPVAMDAAISADAQIALGRHRPQ